MQWIQMNEPGVAASVSTLSKTSDGTIYAVMGYKNIYKLPADQNEWQPVNTDFFPEKTEGSIPIAEHNGTVYIIPSHEMFASNDGGKTWDFVCPCPKGHVQELLITDGHFYVTLNDGVFRSDDGGRSWKKMNNGLESTLKEKHGIRSLRICQNTLFVGTSKGYADIMRTNGNIFNYQLALLLASVHW